MITTDGSSLVQGHVSRNGEKWLVSWCIRELPHAMYMRCESGQEFHQVFDQRNWKDAAAISTDRKDCGWSNTMLESVKSPWVFQSNVTQMKITSLKNEINVMVQRYLLLIYFYTNDLITKKKDKNILKEDKMMVKMKTF